MPAPYYISQVESQNTSVWIPYSRDPLILEIVRQLSRYSNLIVFRSLTPPSGAVHLIIYRPGIISRPLFNYILNTAIRKHSRLIFIQELTSVKDDRKIKLAKTKFRDYSFHFQVLGFLPGTSLNICASEIIRNFLSVNDYQNFKSSVNITAVKKSNMHRILFSFALIILFGFIALASSVYCTFVSYQNRNYLLADRCSRVSALPFNFLPHYTKLFKDLSLSLHLLSGLNISLNYRLANLLNAGLPSSGPSSLGLDNYLDPASEALANAREDLTRLKLPDFLPSGLTASLAASLNSSQLMINQLQALAPQISDFIPPKSKITYLFVIQDSAEIRATGGVISHLVFVTLDHGRLTDIQSLPPSLTGNSILTHIFPPISYQEATGNHDWQLTDANWDPDFPTTADQVSGLISGSLSRNVDVVVSVPTSVLPQILAVTGPLTVPALNTTLTSRNFFSQYLKFVRPEDAVSQDSFLSQTLLVLLNRFKTLNRIQVNSLFYLSMQLLNSRQVMIYPTAFSSSSMDFLAWSGRLTVPPCRSEMTCLSESISLIDSNLSGNKSDAYITREITSGSQITSNQINSSYEITYNYTNKVTDWPGGVYKNYVRLYLPAETIIRSLAIDNRDITAAIALNRFDHGLLVLGFPITLNPGGIVKIHLSTGRLISLSRPFHYQFDFLTQPGLISPPSFGFELKYPADWFATSYAFPAFLSPSFASPGILRYNTHPTTPVKIDIDFR